MAYSDYRSGGGRFGFNISGGEGIEFSLFRNQVIGAMITKSTTGSSQITGAGNGTYLYNITQGIVVVDGEALNIAAAVDQACEAAGNIMANTYSKCYMIIAYKTAAGIAATKIVKGTAALTAAVLPPTVAAIDAGIPDGTPWFALGTMTINRTGDVTVTETVDNLYRPTFMPKTVHD